jgi:hypothetical protein
VDLDAVCSVWAAKQFIDGTQNAAVDFRAANWDGSEMAEGDLALDIAAGGRGMKGETGEGGIVHSCFASIVEQYASTADQLALANLVSFVDAQDAHGSAVKHLLRPRGDIVYDYERGYGADPEFFAESSYVAGQPSGEGVQVLAMTGLNAVLRAFQSTHPRNDSMVVERMSEVFSGMLKAGRARQRAALEADKVTILEGGLVAICWNNREFATNGILFDERNVRVIVYVDGHNLGIIRRGNETLRMDHPELLAVVEKAGESSEWFAHSAGFLFCRGSRKAPAENPSKVDPRELARVAASVLV